MAVGIVEVDATAAVVPVDRALLVLERVRPVVEAALADAPEDLVELLLADEERVVLQANRAPHRVKVERDAVVDLDDEEGAERARRWPPEDLAEERGGALLVDAPDDRVVEL